MQPSPATSQRSQRRVSSSGPSPDQLPSAPISATRSRASSASATWSGYSAPVPTLPGSPTVQSTTSSPTSPCSTSQRVRRSLAVHLAAPRQRPLAAIDPNQPVLEFPQTSAVLLHYALSSLLEYWGVRPTLVYDGLAACDLMIEAVVEDAAVKEELADLRKPGAA